MRIFFFLQLNYFPTSGILDISKTNADFAQRLAIVQLPLQPFVCIRADIDFLTNIHYEISTIETIPFEGELILVLILCDDALSGRS